MRWLLPFTALIFMSTAAIGQQTWIKTFGGSGDDVGKALAPTVNGGFYLTGYTSSNDGDWAGMGKGSRDILVTSHDKSGNLVWKRLFGGTLADEASAIAATPEFGMVIVGYTNSSNGDFPHTKLRGQSPCILKLERNGSVVWSQAEKYLEGDFGEFTSVIGDGDNGFVVVKNRRFPSSIDQNGAPTRQFVWGMGGWVGTKDCIAITSAGHYVLAGETSDTSLFGGPYRGATDISIGRIDPISLTFRVHKFGGSQLDRATTLLPNMNNGVTLAGVTRSTDFDFFNKTNKGESDAFVMRVSEDGEVTWNSTIGGSGDDVIHSGTRLQDGSTLFVGWSDSNDGDLEGLNKGFIDIFVCKLDATGNVLWKRVYGGSDIDMGYSILGMPDGGIVVTGKTFSNDGDFNGMNKGNNDVFVMKLNEDGLLNTETSVDESAPSQGQLVVTPNPVSASTTVCFSLVKPSQVRIDLVNSIGRVVEVLHDQFMTSGTHRSIVNTTSVPSGMYSIRVSSSEGSQTTSLCVIE